MKFDGKCCREHYSDCISESLKMRLRTVLASTSHIGPCLQTLSTSDSVLRTYRIEEVQKAVADSLRGKCPGPDGLPAEFYAAVLGDVQDTLLQVFREVLARGRMCDSQGQGVVVLVPKTPHAATLSEHRPLTMLNADYEILARVVNKRILPLLPQILDPAQVGTGTKRDITSSLCDIRDVISHHERTEEPAAVVVSIDLAGAFNNVHHEFLFRLLERLGFGSKFVS